MGRAERTGKAFLLQCNILELKQQKLKGVLSNKNYYAFACYGWVDRNPVHFCTSADGRWTNDEVSRRIGQCDDGVKASKDTTSIICTMQWTGMINYDKHFLLQVDMVSKSTVRKWSDRGDMALGNAHGYITNRWIPRIVSRTQRDKNSPIMCWTLYSQLIGTNLWGESWESAITLSLRLFFSKINLFKSTFDSSTKKPIRREAAAQDTQLRLSPINGVGVLDKQQPKEWVCMPNLQIWGTGMHMLWSRNYE